MLQHQAENDVLIFPINTVYLPYFQVWAGIINIKGVRGYYPIALSSFLCNLVPGNQIASLGFSHWNIRKGFHTEFHQISKLWDSQPLVTKPTAKYHIRVVFSIKLLLKLIWLKVSSAFNLGQRQQWNFPSLSCGA